MKHIFTPNQKKYFEKKVALTDTATFDSGNVHPVYATFALGRDAEWVCRLFVLDMKEEHEEGIGTFLNIEHLAPALVGDFVKFEATLIEVKGNAVVCSFVAQVNDRIIAKGTTGQKILTKEKLEKLFISLT